LPDYGPLGLELWLVLRLGQYGRPSWQQLGLFEYCFTKLIVLTEDGSGLGQLGLYVTISFRELMNDKVDLQSIVGCISAKSLQMAPSAWGHIRNQSHCQV